MFFCLSLAVAEPNASLFVNVDGSYTLDISLKEEWSEAELRIDHQIGHHQPKNVRHLHFEGTFDNIPSSLHIRMELANEDLGQYINVHVPTLYLPFSQPDLSGTETLELPKKSFQWHIYRQIFYPLRRLVKDE